MERKHTLRNTAASNLVRSSFGAGILFKDTLDTIKIGGFPLGFWFAQQGAIYVFVVLIFVYVRLMNVLDKKYGYNE